MPTLPVGDAGLDYGGFIVVASAGGQTVAYVLLTGPSSLSTYSVSGGLLQASSSPPVGLPARITGGQGCQNMAVDTVDGTLLVVCPQDNTLRGYTIGSGSALTAASWSPTMTPFGTNPASDAGAQGPVYVSSLRATF